MKRGHCSRIQTCLGTNSKMTTSNVSIRPLYTAFLMLVLVLLGRSCQGFSITKTTRMLQSRSSTSTLLSPKLKLARPFYRQAICPCRKRETKIYMKPLQDQQHHDKFSNNLLTRYAYSHEENEEQLEGTYINVEKSKGFVFRKGAAYVIGQSSLILVAVIIAAITKTPNYGLGPNFVVSSNAIQTGFLYVIPLGIIGYVLDLLEEQIPALKDVTKATQRAVLNILGVTFKPVTGFIIALSLSLAAGIGEEMLFRGVLQYEIAARFGDYIGVGMSSIIFGALHAVTPLYAFLASLASIYFGWLYLISDNLTVPIATHAFYDLAALMYAHWTVANMTEDEQQVLMIEVIEGSKSNDSPVLK